MSDDIIASLEAFGPLVSSGYEVPAAGVVMHNAARALEEKNKQIAELEAENAELREALKPFADIAPHYDPPENDDSDPLFDMRHFPTIGMVRAARAALGENDGQ